MGYVTKSFIWLTVQNQLEKGLTKGQAVIEAANELGITVSEVSRAIYYEQPAEFETHGYRVDPKWLEDVMEIAVNAKQMLKRMNYMHGVIKHLDRPEVPLDHRLLDSIKELLEVLETEIVTLIPVSLCTSCAEEPNHYCEKCGGFKWVANNTNNP